MSEQDHRYTVQTFYDAGGQLYTLARVMRLARYELSNGNGDPVLTMPG